MVEPPENYIERGDIIYILQPVRVAKLLPMSFAVAIGGTYGWSRFMTCSEEPSLAQTGRG